MSPSTVFFVVVHSKVFVRLVRVEHGCSDLRTLPTLANVSGLVFWLCSNALNRLDFFLSSTKKVRRAVYLVTGGKQDDSKEASNMVSRTIVSADQELVRVSVTGFNQSD